MITRSQMRRQLRAKGGIMNVAPREKFGLGSSIKNDLENLYLMKLQMLQLKLHRLLHHFIQAMQQ